MSGLGSGSGRKDGAIGDQRAPGDISRAVALFDFFREGKVRMNKANTPVDRIKLGLGIALLAALTGCVGYVDGGYYGGTVVVPGPDVYFYGGGYERGRDVHVYSHRGYESRAVAHPASRGRERKR
jgi:hypothetical protein